MESGDWGECEDGGEGGDGGEAAAAADVLTGAEDGS